MIPVSFGPVKEQLVNKWQTFLVFLLTKLRLDPISFVRYGTKDSGAAGSSVLPHWC